MKIDKEKIGKGITALSLFSVEVCKGIYDMGREAEEQERGTTYSDAVKAISEGLDSDDARSCIAYMSKWKTSEYYRAVCAIANSTMESSDKRSAIVYL